jgi:F0F1-type ATP synthase membrane subunit b/b'
MNENPKKQVIFHVGTSVMFLCISVFVIWMGFKISRAVKAVEITLAEMRQEQKEMKAKAEAGGEVKTQKVLYSAACVLDNIQLLSSTDAESITNEAIKKISARSEEWGKTARAVNDSIIRQMGTRK